MRTTLEIPDALAQRAKLAAVRRGVSLKTLVADALERELAAGARPHRATAGRLPVIRSRHPGTYDLRPDQIADILMREEAAAYETAQRR